MDPYQQTGNINHEVSFGSALEHLFSLSDLKQCWTLGVRGLLQLWLTENATKKKQTKKRGKKKPPKDIASDNI